MNANQRYVLNGDWAIDWPGIYEVAGTKVRYARTADVHESLEATGPTLEDLSVMVREEVEEKGLQLSNMGPWFFTLLPGDLKTRVVVAFTHLLPHPPGSV